MPCTASTTRPRREEVERGRLDRSFNTEYTTQVRGPLAVTEGAHMYIGGGAVVLILIIIVVVLLMRRR